MPTRILLVEDNSKVREFCGRALTAAGYEVLAFSNAAAALEQTEFVPDVLITDFGLPADSGLDLSKALQAKHQTLLVLLISGHPLEEFYDDELPLTHGYLEKPFNATELVSALQKLLTPRAPTEQNDASTPVGPMRSVDEWRRITGPYEDWE